MVCFCLLDSKEGTCVSNDCKNMEMDLSCAVALPLYHLEKELNAGESKMSSVSPGMGSSV